MASRLEHGTCESNGSGKATIMSKIQEGGGQRYVYVDSYDIDWGDVKDKLIEVYKLDPRLSANYELFDFKLNKLNVNSYDSLLAYYKGNGLKLSNTLVYIYAPEQKQNVIGRKSKTDRVSENINVADTAPVDFSPVIVEADSSSELKSEPNEQLNISDHHYSPKTRIETTTPCELHRDNINATFEDFHISSTTNCLHQQQDSTPPYTATSEDSSFLFNNMDIFSFSKSMEDLVEILKITIKQSNCQGCSETIVSILRKCYSLNSDSEQLDECMMRIETESTTMIQDNTLTTSILDKNSQLCSDVWKLIEKNDDIIKVPGFYKIKKLFNEYLKNVNNLSVKWNDHVKKQIKLNTRNTHSRQKQVEHRTINNKIHEKKTQHHSNNRQNPNICGHSSRISDIQQQPSLNLDNINNNCQKKSNERYSTFVSASNQRNNLIQHNNTDYHHQELSASSWRLNVRTTHSYREPSFNHRSQYSSSSMTLNCDRHEKNHYHINTSRQSYRNSEHQPLSQKTSSLISVAEIDYFETEQKKLYQRLTSTLDQLYHQLRYCNFNNCINIDLFSCIIHDINQRPHVVFCDALSVQHSDLYLMERGAKLEQFFLKLENRSRTNLIESMRQLIINMNNCVDQLHKMYSRCLTTLRSEQQQQQHRTQPPSLLTLRTQNQFPLSNNLETKRHNVDDIDLDIEFVDDLKECKRRRNSQQQQEYSSQISDTSPSESSVEEEELLSTASRAYRQR
ncbi:unnamed protein product [Didymodactylos carnosus]|uniref:Uncharacterized protein n=1 Tax=Didymodactylos carnosus TaxID=1234261 RepID=A0A813VVX4_9BILA|nr:unnamed protein product [Didymodactylos carnosus]CAF3633423.1 unnamed protein product [Didymodactylos carnosus]